MPRPSVQRRLDRPLGNFVDVCPKLLELQRREPRGRALHCWRTSMLRIAGTALLMACSAQHSCKPQNQRGS